jgi:glycosyltransferase involved in cell wall biosynthesis
MTYDLMIFEFTEDFVRSRFGLVPILDEIREIVSFVNQVARRKGTFIGISWYVMNNQVRRYLPAIRPELADVVYIPVMINNSISPLASAVVRSKFRIEGPYVFYPTQIRPYKGVTDLLKAMQIINARGTEYKVVLTGQSLEGDSEAAHFIENNNLDKLVVLTGDVNEAELARLYLDATLVICPSHFEGGIHQPLLEAMHWGVPAVASRLPQTLERLDFHNTKENQSYLFQVGNIEELIETIEKVLADRDQTIATQRAIMDRLSDYDWAQAAEKMHSILTKTMTHKPQD